MTEHSEFEVVGRGGVSYTVQLETNVRDGDAGELLAEYDASVLDHTGHEMKGFIIHFEVKPTTASDLAASGCDRACLVEIGRSAVEELLRQDLS